MKFLLKMASVGRKNTLYICTLQINEKIWKKMHIFTFQYMYNVLSMRKSFFINLAEKLFPVTFKRCPSGKEQRMMHMYGTMLKSDYDQTCIYTLINHTNKFNWMCRPVIVWKYPIYIVSEICNAFRKCPNKCMDRHTMHDVCVHTSYSCVKAIASFSPFYKLHVRVETEILNAQVYYKAQLRQNVINFYCIL